MHQNERIIDLNIEWSSFEKMKNDPTIGRWDRPITEGAGGLGRLIEMGEKNRSYPIAVIRQKLQIWAR